MSLANQFEGRIAERRPPNDGSIRGVLHHVRNPRSCIKRSFGEKIAYIFAWFWLV